MNQASHHLLKYLGPDACITACLKYCSVTYFQSSSRQVFHRIHDRPSYTDQALSSKSGRYIKVHKIRQLTQLRMRATGTLRHRREEWITSFLQLYCRCFIATSTYSAHLWRHQNVSLVSTAITIAKYIVY